MQISRLSPFGVTAYVRIREPAPVRSSTGSEPQDRQQKLQELRELVRYVTDLRESLSKTQSSFRAALSRVKKSGSLASRIASAQPLGLDPSETATRIESADEINAIGTSYNQQEFSFSGDSTTVPLIGGIYDGSNQDQMLTIRSRSDGVVGGNHSLVFDVLDANDDRIDRLTFEQFDPPGTIVTLDIGLTLSLSAGVVELNDEFQVQVSASVGSSVKPDKPFNGTLSDQPDFEPGQTVTSGTFEVNGEQIVVDDHDSINSVVDKINQSAAGVTASFDAGTERIKIQQQTLGSTPQISLTNDTSGFLAATKLDSATAISGKDRDSATALSALSVFSGVSAGSFEIDGQLLFVDPATDSLEDVIVRINSSVSGLTANYSSTQDVFEFLPGDRSSVRLGDGSSHLFSALGIPPREFDLVPRRSTLVKRLGLLETERFAELLQRSIELQQPSAVTAVQDKLFAMVAKKFSDKNRSHRPDQGLDVAGMQFNADRAEASVSFDADELGAALRRKDRDLLGLFLDQPGEGGRESLFTQLLDELRGVEQELRIEFHQLGGRYVDIRV